jgi:hypothetical protein
VILDQVIRLICFCNGKSDWPLGPADFVFHFGLGKIPAIELRYEASCGVI